MRGVKQGSVERLQDPKNVAMMLPSKLYAPSGYQKAAIADRADKLRDQVTLIGRKSNMIHEVPVCS